MAEPKDSPVGVQKKRVDWETDEGGVEGTGGLKDEAVARKNVLEHYTQEARKKGGSGAEVFGECSVTVFCFQTEPSLTWI